MIYVIALLAEAAAVLFLGVFRRLWVAPLFHIYRAFGVVRDREWFFRISAVVSLGFLAAITGILLFAIVASR